MSADEEVKDVYAHFGLAYYLAGVFETGLALAILKLDFLAQQRQQVELRRGIPFDREAFNARYDAFLERQHSQTLGNLVRRLRELIDVPEDFARKLTEVKQRRDFIAHHFFRERAEVLQLSRGRKAILAELRADQELFEGADRELDELLKPHEAAIGINRVALQAYIDRYLETFERDIDWNRVSKTTLQTAVANSEASGSWLLARQCKTFPLSNTKFTQLPSDQA